MQPDMVASCNDWVSDSNAAFVLSLVRPARDQGDEGEDRNAAAATFPPEFTYPLFAEERLFGYQAPRIDLQFASGSLVPYYSFTYRRAVPEAEGKPDDVVGELRKWLPEDDVEFTDHDLFMARAALDHATFRPLGDKVHEYRTKAGDGDGGDDVVYEIHKSSFDDPQFAKYFRRAQIFNIFFIEGATFLDEDDRWEIMTIFERRESPSGEVSYHYVGHCTMYLFYSFPDKRRLRIRWARLKGLSKSTVGSPLNFLVDACYRSGWYCPSQFLILPPYQKRGHASMLYEQVQAFALSREDVMEITVEEPSAAFTQIRDKCDIRSLEKMFPHPELLQLDKAIVEEARKQLKVSKSQARRCAELYFLKHLNPSDAKQYRRYRIFVKERLYRSNELGLAPLPRAERWQKLKEAYREVENEHAAYLRSLKL